MEILFVKLFMLVIAAAFLYVFVFFFLNVEAPDGIKNASLLMASVIPLLGIAFTLVSSPSIVNRRFALVLFYDNQNQRVIEGTGSWNVYAYRYMPMFFNFKENDFIVNDHFKELLGPRGLDFVEYGIIWTLSQKFSTDWNIETGFSHEIPGGQVSQFKNVSTDREKEQVTPSQIRAIFAENQFLKDETKYNGTGFYLPGGSTIQTRRTNEKRTILIENRDTRVEISISPISGGPIQQGIPGVIQKDPTDMNRFLAFDYAVEFDGRLNKFLPIPWKKKEALRHWHENITIALEKFHWKSVDDNIKDALNRKAIELILEEKTAHKAP